MLRNFAIALVVALTLAACGQAAQSDAAASSEAAASGDTAAADETAGVVGGAEAQTTVAAQASGECQSQPGRPTETLDREWAGEFVVDATPGTTSCAPPRGGVVTCTVRGPARVWADGDSYTSHSVVPEGRTATFTLTGAQSRCVLG